ncbi:hypothetical protein [Paenibacillus sp. BK720]|uniref:hypothetical protein n=1 Tax=Paenibacillus sp. BK720 TaxID=2587092 RepID=UPI00141D7B3D|nr:hypothetical protein [Paenibacillus sp. BK720]NIK68772.1 hypothetical protein [Paenibacillus sp. BK720]
MRKKQPELQIVKIAWVRDGVEVDGPSEEAILRILKFVKGGEWEKRVKDGE